MLLGKNKSIETITFVAHSLLFKELGNKIAHFWENQQYNITAYISVVFVAITSNGQKYSKAICKSLYYLQFV